MNLFDYLKWRGDLTFKADPFNEVDNLILSSCVYVNLEGIVPSDSGTITLKEASDLYFKKYKPTEEEMDQGFSEGAPRFIRAMAETTRFKDILLHNEKTVNDDVTPCQFSAIVYDIDKHTSYIAYRGTDSSMNGWQEDFEISYHETMAQKLAVEYLEENAKGLFRKYIVGGHSKGGNLAQYAASKCSKKTRKKLITVYSNDGPGIFDGLFEENIYQEIKERYIKIVPAFSVFGRMFDSSDSNIVIESDAAMIMQHDPSTWQIEGTRFVRAEGFDPDSEKLMEEFNEFLMDVDTEKREVFSRQIFEMFKEAGIRKVGDLTDLDYKDILKIIDDIKDMDPVAKKVAIRLFKVVTDTIDDTAKVKVKKLIGKK